MPDTTVPAPGAPPPPGSAASACAYLTVTAFAELLGVGVEHALRLIRDGRVRAVNVSRGTRRPRWRIPRSAVAEFESATRPEPEVTHAAG